jgi:two-component system C4-dicarboxylate transport sensor histidine kinase DctB
VPGYLSAAAAPHEDGVLGVGVVKIDPPPSEDAWRKGGERLALADTRGIVFLSSRPNRKYCKRR